MRDNSPPSFPTLPKAERGSLATVAKRYGVTRQAVGYWRRCGVDVSDPDAVARWRAEHRQGGLRIVGGVARAAAAAPKAGRAAEAVAGPRAALPAPPAAPAARSTGESLGSLADAKTRLAAEQADWQALRNAQRRGELVPLADHDRVMRETVGPVVEYLDAMPARFGGAFGGDLGAAVGVLQRIAGEVRRIIRREVRP